MRWLAAAFIVFAAASCARGRSSPSASSPALATDPVVAAAQEQQALEHDLSLRFEAHEVIDCVEAERLRDQICTLADRICAIAEREPEREALCRDSRDRCERARQRVEQRCGPSVN
jgi:hypothetical protein